MHDNPIRWFARSAAALWLSLLLLVWGGAVGAASSSVSLPPQDPYPSSYTPYPSQPTLIRNAVILDGTGRQLEQGSVAFVDGRIAAIGETVDAPPNALVIDGQGRWLTPGLIDIHTHQGVYSSPGLASNADGNESTNPSTPDAWIEHSVWPQDIAFARSLAGGVTTMLVLPGSANLFGGRTVTLKTVPARTVQEMKFPGAPYGIKMACGENPKRHYKSRGPATRMGNFAGYRNQWIAAVDYKRKWDAYAEKGGKQPSRNLKLETLAGVLAGDIRTNVHCYRADEMALFVDLAKEFGFKVNTFHHAVEAYKIRDYFADQGICAAVWAGKWGMKLEAYDAIDENAALLHEAGACAIIHSDDTDIVQRLNQEAGKALADGRHAGVVITDAQAIAWITSNPARALGILEQTGTLEVGKMADMVLWSANPFSVYALAEQVYVDGALLYERGNAARSPIMDVELGHERTVIAPGAVN